MHILKNRNPILNIVKNGFYMTMSEIMNYKKLYYAEKQKFEKSARYRDKEQKYKRKSEYLFGKKFFCKKMLKECVACN